MAQRKPGEPRAAKTQNLKRQNIPQSVHRTTIMASIGRRRKAGAKTAAPALLGSEGGGAAGHRRKQQISSSASVSSGRSTRSTSSSLLKKFRLPKLGNVGRTRRSTRGAASQRSSSIKKESIASSPFSIADDLVSSTFSYQNEDDTSTTVVESKVSTSRQDESNPNTSNNLALPSPASAGSIDEQSTGTASLALTSPAASASASTEQLSAATEFGSPASSATPASTAPKPPANVASSEDEAEDKEATVAYASPSIDRVRNSNASISPSTNEHAEPLDDTKEGEGAFDDLPATPEEQEEAKEEPVEEIVAISQQSQETLSNDISPTSARDDGECIGEEEVLVQGAKVHVVGGKKYKGMFGTLSGFSKSGNSAYVSIAGYAKEPCLPLSYLQIVQEGTRLPEINASSSEEYASEESSSEKELLVEGVAVRIVKGTHKGKSGVISGLTSKGNHVYVSPDGVAKGPRVIRSFEYLKIIQLNDGMQAAGKQPDELNVEDIVAASGSPAAASSERRPDPCNMQVEVPLNCDSGISSCITLATGILSPKIQNNDADVPTPSLNSTVSDSNDARTVFGDFYLGQKVKISKGTHKGLSGTVIKINNTFLKVRVDGKGEKRVAKTSIEGYCSSQSSSPISCASAKAPTSTKGRTTTTRKNTMVVATGGEWKVPDSNAGGTRFGSRMVEKLRLVTKEQKVDGTFLSYYLGNRIKIIEIPLNASESSVPFDITVQENGYRYELISAKVKEDTDAPSFQYSKNQCVRLIYAQVAGPLLAELSLENMLQDIADFSSLEPRKVVARLELFQSPALKIGKQRGIFMLNSSDVCECDDNGNDGCGFIDENYLENLLGGKKYGKDTLAIHIRFFSPSVGVLKGMLMRKRSTDGPPIELQPSMKKVMASLTNSSSTKACLVITQAGRHPNPINQYIGRMLDPNLKAPPRQSFNKLIKPLNKKPISENADMIPRLLQGVGVPRHVCDAYVTNSKKMNGLNHAYIVGVSDPTDALPAGHGFVSGFTNVTTPNNELFVTRSPCTKASDARMVPMVTTKPEKMSQEDWNWLLDLPFGVLIFANPKKGTQPLPVQIATGDLDGDLYFICWNSELLSYIETDPIVEIPLGEEATEASSNKASLSDDWLLKAQNVMVDSIAVEELGALTGELYKLSQKAADNSSSFMRDEDAVAFADAFNKALEYKKHGGRIELPGHLHAQVSARLRKYLA